jgi:hypothetical protein
MITAEGLTKQRGGRAVVSDVTFRCEPGTITGSNPNVADSNLRTRPSVDAHTSRGIQPVRAYSHTALILHGVPKDAEKRPQIPMGKPGLRQQIPAIGLLSPLMAGRAPTPHSLTMEEFSPLSSRVAVRGVTAPRATNRFSTAARWWRHGAGDHRRLRSPYRADRWTARRSRHRTPVDAMRERAGSVLELAKNSPENRPESLTSVRATNSYPQASDGKWLQTHMKCRVR